MNKEQLQQLINNHYTSRVDFVKDVLPYTEPNFKGVPSQSNTAKVVSDHLNGRTKPNAFTSAFYRLWFEVKTMNMTIIELCSICREYSCNLTKISLLQSDIENCKKYRHLEWLVRREKEKLTEINNRQEEIKELILNNKVITF